MGGKPKQVNSGQAGQSATDAHAATTQDLAISKQNQAYQARLMGMLFGSGAKGSSGSLTGFMDPSKLDEANLTGAYKSAYSQGTDQLAKDYSNARGSLAQSWANRGMGSNSTPSGFQADQERQLGSSLADSRGAAFSDALGKQHGEALNNFWNANNVASGHAATSGTTATTAASGAGNTAAGIFGTAGKQAQTGTSPQTGIAEAALCVTAGMRILKPGDEWIQAEFLKPGDILLGIDGRGDEVIEVEQTAPQLVCDVATLERTARVSGTHAFDRADGGYVCAGSALGETLNTLAGREDVIAVEQLPDHQVCYYIRVKRSHGYNVEGFWSLE